MFGYYLVNRFSVCLLYDKEVTLKRQVRFEVMNSFKCTSVLVFTLHWRTILHPEPPFKKLFPKSSLKKKNCWQFKVSNERIGQS